MNLRRSCILTCALLFVSLGLFGIVITFFNIPDLYTAIVTSSDVVVPPAARPSARDSSALNEAYGDLPMHFEQNAGQTDRTFDFIARGEGYSLGLGADAVMMHLTRGSGSERESSYLGISLSGGARTKAVPERPSAGRSNYLIGRDRSKWITGVRHYEAVRYPAVYPGIDVIYYGNGRKLEYDFVVKPGASVENVNLRFAGVEDVRIDEVTGDLLLETAAGTFKQLRPVAYQETADGRVDVASSYVIEQAGSDNLISIRVEPYDTATELVIDPILTYGTYLGGTQFEEGRSIAVDAQGNAYVIGSSSSLNFPTTPASLKSALLPRTDSATNFLSDAFVAKLDPSGTALVYSTFFGGRNGSELGTGIALDAAGNVMISGTTTANDLPAVNAYQPIFGGTDDAFAAKLNATGSSLLYSTYLGGNGTDIGARIAWDRTSGDAVFVGSSSSPDFPTTSGAYRERLCNTPVSCSGIFFYGSYAVKLSATGSIVYSTLFNAGINDVAIDQNGNAVLGGEAGLVISGGVPSFQTTPGSVQPAHSGGIDGMVAKLNPAGSAVIYGTFLGGGLQSDRVTGLTLDSAGNIYVTGRTENSAFPTTDGAFDRVFNGAEDGFVAKINAAGSTLLYSTFLGGVGKDQPFSIKVGSDGCAFVAGETTSINFPIKNSLNGPYGTIFLTKLNPAGSGLVYSSLLGYGGAYGVAVDPSDNAYITGHTTSVPVTAGALQTMRGEPNHTATKDAFILKIGSIDETLQTFSISGVVNDPVQFGNPQPIVVTISGTVNRSMILPYGGGSGVIPYYFGGLPAGGNYTITAKKPGFDTEPISGVFNGLATDQFADFNIVPNRTPEAVITSPSYGASYSAPASINITATATDPDGDAISRIEFEAYHNDLGRVVIGSDSTAPYSITWNNVPAGTWSISAFPVDAKGLRGVSTPVVHVFVNDPSPVSVKITSPTALQQFVQGIYIPVGVTVSQSVSSVVIRDQNGQVVVSMNGTPWQGMWRPMIPGTYTLTATASNTQGQTATSPPMTVVVKSFDHRVSGRVIDSITQQGVAGVTVKATSQSKPTLNVSTVTDSTGSYVFSGLGASTEDDLKLTPERTGYTFNPAYRSILYLGYVDWEHMTFVATKKTQITVALTKPSDGAVVKADDTIGIAANAASTAGPIKEVRFYARSGANDVLLFTDLAAPYEYDWKGAAPGGHAIFARAVDSTGDLADSAPVTIQVIGVPSTIRLQGDITDPQGSYRAGIRVRLTGAVDGVAIDQMSISNYFGAYGFFNLPKGGNYTITPEAPGVTFSPASFSVTNATADNYDIDFVSSAPNIPPTVEIKSPANGAVFTMPAVIQISAAANDPDGFISHFRIAAEGNGEFKTIGQVNTGSFSAPWQPLKPGDYKIWASAVDAGGIQIDTSINIRVDPPAPLTVAGRVVDRMSRGVAGVTLELREYPEVEGNETAPRIVATGSDGRYSIPDVTAFRGYVLVPTNQDLTFAPERRILLNLASGLSAADFTATQRVQAADFDGDKQSDISVWRPTNSTWYIESSESGEMNEVSFAATELAGAPVPGNYDGDKKVDHATYYGGRWLIRYSSTGELVTQKHGRADDIPVPADYDGDGTTDIAVFRQRASSWLIKRSSDGRIDLISFGKGGQIPHTGDVDGDGMADLIVWRPVTADWVVQKSSDGLLITRASSGFGEHSFVADIDADKKDELIVYSAETGTWHITACLEGPSLSKTWGESGFRPAPGDYDRDGKTDLALFRPGDSTWKILRSSDDVEVVRQMGDPGDMPVAAAFVKWATNPQAPPLR